jgi:phenylalanyl-tRNA synthetase beta chain
MKLSKSFLNDYVDVSDISINDIASKMISAGNEYDSIESLAKGTNLVIGLVLDKKPHPDSDHLNVCQVQVNENTVLQIVCGAPNVDKGQKVIVALEGAVLPNDFVIKKTSIRGVESNGMICSLEELGVDSKYLTEEDKKGIHVLDSDAKIGDEPLSYLGLDEKFIDFELTCNRSDLLSVIGMAYEVGAIYDRKVNLPYQKPSQEIENIENYFSVDVKTDKCPLFLSRLVKNVVIKESPKEIKLRLIASGIRPINNVVDISNYVMLEYGQPLHFYDYDKLGNKIIVREGLENEELTTLDGVVRKLKISDIVIANKDNRAVGLAGVMGGLDTEVDENTKNILVEAAIFNPASIRKTSKEILRSEASNRFEKGLDPNNTFQAIERACYLLEQYASGEVIKGTIKHQEIESIEKIIEISLKDINKILGIELELKTIEDVFKRLNFEYFLEDETFKVNVPSRRLDVNIKEDLIEEVARINGLDKLVGKLPITPIKAGGYSPNYKINKIIKEHLSSLGLNEVINYSLIDKKSTNTFEVSEKKLVNIANPMTEDRMYLRTNLISSLINVMDYNHKRKVNDVSIYEISKVYYKENDNYIEKTMLGILTEGKYLANSWNGTSVKNDFYLMKGIIENLLEFLGFNNRYSFDTIDLPKEYHPYRSARITLDNQVLGYIGEVNPSLNMKEVLLASLELDVIYNSKVRSIKCKEISKYPSISKDVAFIFDKNITSDEIIKTIKKSGTRLLEDVTVFDVYTGDKIDTNKRSLAFSLTFTDVTKTLTEEEVMLLFNKIIEDVTTKYNAVLRDK